MKKLVLLSFCVLFSAAIASAGIFRQSAKVVEGSAKLGYKAAKPAAKASAKVVKKSAKVAYKVIVQNQQPSLTESERAVLAAPYIPMPVIGKAN